MRGTASLTLRAGRLESALARRTVRRVSPWNLDALSDADLEALLPLAEKQAAADAAGTGLHWTAKERLQLEALWAKQAGATP